MRALLEFWTKCFDNEGRTSCRDYCLCFLVYRVLLFLIAIFGGIDNEAFALLLVLFLLFSTLPSIFMTIRRLHDIGKNGAYFCYSFIPLIGGIMVFVFCITPGDPHTNRFGPSPVYKWRLIEKMELLNNQWKMTFSEADVANEDVAITSKNILDYASENQCENDLTAKLEEVYGEYKNHGFIK